MQIAHALNAARLASDKLYYEEYVNEVKGKSRSGDGMAFYPDYVQSKKNSKMASKVGFLL